MKITLAWLVASLLTSPCVFAQSTDTTVGRIRGVDAPLSECLVLSPDAAGQLSDWGCNTIRLVVDANPKGSPTETDPLAPYQESLEKVRSFLPSAREHHLQVIISLGNVYGRTSDSFWSDGDAGVKSRAAVADFWKAFATKFKSESQIVGYDLLNQPNDPKPDSSIWSAQIIPAAVSAVRSVNPDIWLIVQPGQYGAPYGFLSFKPIEDKHTMYGVRFFFPQEYTFQGISSQAKDLKGKLAYPGTGPSGATYNRQALRDSMLPAINFGQTNHVRMIVLEFGLARWAPGADKWTQDAISIFEEQGWDWLYHDFFGWNGMNPTYGPNDPESGIAFGGKQTPQFMVLTEAWKKNNP